MNLAALATEENWQAFDESWTELMGAEGTVEELLEALEIVGQKRRMSRCMPMVRDHAELLIAGDRSAEAAELLGTSLRGGGAVGEVSELLLSTARTAWGEEPWWDAFCETAEFRPGAPDLRVAWSYFQDMKSYRADLVIFHAAGWGAGEVTGVDPEKLEVDVTFQSGRKDRFPLRTAVEIFEVLPETDLRAMAMRDPDGVKILVDVLKRSQGRLIQGSAALALGYIGDRRAVDALIGLLENRSAPDLSRAFAAVSLGVLIEGREVPLLARFAAANNYLVPIAGIQDVFDIL